MGRTLPSYRIMLEKERDLWQKRFSTRLRTPYRSGFDEVWLYAFQLADAASSNTRPVVFDNILMSMIVAQQTELQKLQSEVTYLKQVIERMK